MSKEVEITAIQTVVLFNAIREIIREEFANIEANKPKPMKLHTSDQVMKILDISESTFRRFVKDGTIKAVKVRGRIRVKDEELQNLLKEVKSLKYRRA